MENPQQDESQQNTFIDALKEAVQPLIELQKKTIQLQLLNIRYSRSEISDVLVSLGRFSDELKLHEKDEKEKLAITQQTLSHDQAIEARQNYDAARFVTETLRQKIKDIREENPLIVNALNLGLY
jgi:hypothetical protein